MKRERRYGNTGRGHWLGTLDTTGRGKTLLTCGVVRRLTTRKNRGLFVPSPASVIQLFVTVTRQCYRYLPPKYSKTRRSKGEESEDTVTLAEDTGRRHWIPLDEERHVLYKIGFTRLLFLPVQCKSALRYSDSSRCPQAICRSIMALGSVTVTCPRDVKGADSCESTPLLLLFFFSCSSSDNWICHHRRDFFVVRVGHRERCATLGHRTQISSVFE